MLRWGLRGVLILGLPSFLMKRVGCSSFAHIMMLARCIFLRMNISKDTSPDRCMYMIRYIGITKIVIDPMLIKIR